MKPNYIFRFSIESEVNPSHSTHARVTVLLSCCLLVYYRFGRTAFRRNVFSILRLLLLRTLVFTYLQHYRVHNPDHDNTNFQWHEKKKKN